MNTPTAIVIAAAILAISHMVFSRYEMQVSSSGQAVYTLDKWSGDVAFQAGPTRYKPVRADQ